MSNVLVDLLRRLFLPSRSRVPLTRFLRPTTVGTPVGMEKYICPKYIDLKVNVFVYVKDTPFGKT